MSYLRIPALLAEGIFFISENKLFVLLAINVPLLILGMLMDMGVLILLPIVSKVRVDPIHFGG